VIYAEHESTIDLFVDDAIIVDDAGHGREKLQRNLPGHSSPSPSMSSFMKLRTAAGPMATMRIPRRQHHPAQALPSSLQRAQAASAGLKSDMRLSPCSLPPPASRSNR
jgi:hypothetical protein